MVGPSCHLEKYNMHVVHETVLSSPSSCIMHYLCWICSFCLFLFKVASQFFFFPVMWHFYLVAFRLDFIFQNFIYPSFALFCLFGAFIGYIGSVSFLNTILEVVSKLRTVNPKLTYGELDSKAQLSCELWVWSHDSLVFGLLCS